MGYTTSLTLTAEQSPQPHPIEKIMTDVDVKPKTGAITKH